MRQLLEEEIPSYELEKRLIHADREVSWVMLNASLVSDETGAHLYCIHQVQDIGERKRFEVHLAHLADHDPLTGLFNRRRFGSELSREISAARRYGGGGAVLIIDIDNFKQINDTLGHNAGDEVMMEVAHLWRAWAVTSLACCYRTQRPMTRRSSHTRCSTRCAGRAWRWAESALRA
jgi:GGDEF domain-containing protein